MSVSLNLHVRSVVAHQVSSRDAGAWAELEACAVEPNAYLSPHFVCAAARHLALRHVPSVFFVERSIGGAQELVGVAVLGKIDRSLRHPAGGMTGRWTSYAPLSGMLLEQEQMSATLEALLRFLQKHSVRCDLVQLPMAWADGPLASVLKTSAPAVGYASHARDQASRAVLAPSAARGQLESKLLRRQVRDLDRRARRLGEQGDVGWRSHRHEGVSPQVVDRFLALENMGWKSEAGSSLRSSTHGEAFFREMVAGFAAERRAFFTELTLDDAAIAVTCNLISGNVGFAFKIGWDPKFRAYSPGWLNELEIMRQADTLLGDLAYIDSGAAPGSYLDRLWLDRRPLTTLSIPLTLAGRLALGGINSARWLKHRCASVAGWVRGSSAHLEQKPA